MADKQYHFDIAMSCSGCSGAIDRVLKKMEGEGGVKSYTVSLENQTADVTATPELEYATVLEKIKKTGKTVKGAQVDGVPQEI